VSHLAALPELPRGIRIAAMVCLVLSGLTGLFSLTEALGLSRLSELKEAGPSRFTLVGDPAVTERAFEAQYSALEPMREARSLVLGALSVACAFAFVSAGRLLRPGGLSMERMRRMLGATAFAAAALRTIDGAQWAVVVRRTAQAMAEAMSTLPEFKDPALSAQLQSTLPSILLVGTGFHTLLIAGTFALLGQYFHSERVRQAITARDPSPDEEED
jgi:hypothetical protein